MKQTVQVEVDTTKVEQEAYKKGLDEAWELARKIVAFPNDGGLRTDDLVKIFGLGTSREVIRKCTASEALAKLRDYEEKKAEAEAVKVGDEIVFGEAHVLVTYVDDDSWNGVLLNDCYCGKSGHCYTCMETFSGWHKTGRHFPEIAAVLE